MGPVLAGSSLMMCSSRSTHCVVLRALQMAPPVARFLMKPRVAQDSCCSLPSKVCTGSWSVQHSVISVVTEQCMSQ